MEKRNIGKSGLSAPFLGLGTWAIGGGRWWGDNDDALSVKAIETAVEQGIVWIDTAPIYGLTTAKRWWARLYATSTGTRSSSPPSAALSGGTKALFSTRSWMVCRPYIGLVMRPFFGKLLHWDVRLVHLLS